MAASILSLASFPSSQARRSISMAKETAFQWSAPISSYLLPRGDTFLYCLALCFILSLLSQHLSRCSALSPHFEGFEADDDEEENPTGPSPITDLPIPPPVLTQSHFEETDRGPPEQSAPSVPPSPKPSPAATFEYWDEDEFEGLPPPASDPIPPESPSSTDTTSEPSDPIPPSKPPPPRSYAVEIVSISFLIAFVLNYFTGKRENENIALAWAAKFATKDSIFEKNFSLLGTGDGNDAPLLLKEGQDVFKFYASGRRFCQGLLATMELKCRHDLIARIYNLIVPSRDTITFEVYMNDENMDQVLFAMARKKAAKTMQKEVKDLQRYASLMSTPTGRKWVAEDLAVVTESKEAAGDLVTDAVLEQVFGDKAFEKFGKLFISLHFSDQHAGTHRKVLMFKFGLPDANSMADMTRLVALIPYYIDLVGRYKLSPQARSKTEAARAKVAQEAYKELQMARQEAFQKKKAERKKMMEEAEAKLSAEAIRRREDKERARQVKKSGPKVKMTRAR